MSGTRRGRRKARHLPGLACVVASAAAALSCAPSDSANGPERIILIVADTLRADRVGPYGARIETPHIDALAEQGQLSFPMRSRRST